MSGRQSRTPHRQRPAVEGLETRAVPATFGVPWSDPSRLTLSFVPDGTPIAAHTSSLVQTLGALQPSAAWQRDALRAFQTWAVNSNINIGLVADGGQPLGVAGAAQHDPRFGDVRIAGQAMAADALAITVPTDPSVSSTLSGDVLINTADDFGKVDLFSVLLHEAGHVLGLGETTDPKSPMYDQFLGNSKLTAGDVANLQGLYGTRAPDKYEGSGGNDSIARATTLPTPGGWTGATPLVAFGDVTTNKDVDVYAFRAPGGYKGPVTFRLQSAGISLLAPRISILDAGGHVLGQAQAASDLGDVVTVRLAAADPGATYFLKVEAATTDVFGVGSYGVAVSCDSATNVIPETVDSVLRGPYQSLGPNEITSLLLGSPGVLLNNDHGSDDGPLSATSLSPSPGYARNSHYEAVASLSGPTDSDFYRIQTADAPPGGKPLVLTVTARSLAVNGTTPRVTILDRDGNPVASQVLANAPGLFSIQAAGVKPGGNYFLKVGPDASAGSAPAGNYALTAQFGTAAAQPSTFASGTLDATGAAQSFNLYVGQTQLMNLLLSVGGGPAAAGSVVALTVLDKAGKLVFSLTGGANDVVSGPAVFLTPGAYTVRLTALDARAPLTFRLLGGGVSDPVGPVLTDPTLAPDYKVPGLPDWFLYPGGTLTKSPFQFSPLSNT